MSDSLKGSNRQVYNFVSALDMTTNRYRAARFFDSLTVALVSATTNPIIGLQENIPQSGTGAAVRVCVSGISFGIAGAAFTAGAALTIDANGQAVALNTTTQIRLGTAMQSAAAASEVVSVMVQIDNSARPGS